MTAARLGWVILGGALLVALWYAGRLVGGYLPDFAAWIEARGALAPLVFVLGYIVATIAFIPGSILTLAAGVVFGLFWGTVYTLIGATIGSIGAFLVARYLARPAIERRVKGDARFSRLDHAISRQGLKVVFLLRLSPVLPYNLMNYALGLTRVRLIDYTIASIGMIPGTLLYVYYGRAAGDIATLAAGAGVRHDTIYYIFLALGLLATIVLTVMVTRLANRALRDETENGGALGID